MAEISAEEPLSNVSESSFVILGQGSLPPSIADETDSKSLSNPSLKMTNSTSLMSDTGSILEGNVQDKLIKLLKENYALKETLNQNNLAIKSQLDTFIMWQQEVLKTHESHKQKFLETKELILKLRAENAGLKKQIDETSNNSASGSLIKSETIGENKMKEKNSAEEICRLKNEVQRLEDKCKDLDIKNENLNVERIKLLEDVKVAEKKIMESNKELEDVMRENNFLKQRIAELQTKSTENYSLKSLPNAEARAQISNLFKQLEEERGKVTKLKEELEVARAGNPVEAQSKLSTSEELAEYITKLDDMTESLDKQNQRFNSIISWVSLAEENLNALKSDQISEGVDCLIMSEIAQLKSHLHQEENCFKEKQENLQEIHGQFCKLLDDYKELQQQVSLLGNNSSVSQQFKEEIANLTSQLKNKDEELISKSEECEKLKEDIKKLNLECEEVALLKVQVQLYQNDFNDERAARERLAGEKEEMAEQIRHLQSRLESYEGDKSKKSNNPSTPSEEKKSRYVCPKCMFSFSNLKNCEEHVEECVNIHMYP